jgi:2-oxoglutarate dehydrogenase E2 component (dihydrolipoamide succinyltransferase)
MPVEIRVPAMGEGITDVIITKWLVQQGEQVKKDTPLVEIATDKVDSEIVSTHEGIVQQILFAEGATVKIGESLIILTASSEEHSSASYKPTKPVEKQINHALQSEKTKKSIYEPVKLQINTSKQKFISPFVHQLAMSEGIQVDELESIQGTGENYRITKDDIIAFVENRKHSAQVSIKNPSEQAVQLLPPNENEIHIELDRMRKLIAKNMLLSKKTSPHVTSFVEANVSKIVNWRNKVKSVFQNKYNEKITYLPIIVEAVAKALKDFPSINASLQNDTLVIKKKINIGIATALQNGNLIVPVIKHADNLGIPGLVKSINELTKKARESMLLPTDIQGSTFTISNIGTFGNIGGTPIINQPELAILAIGAFIKKPVAVKIGDEYGIAIQDTVELWLSYDHRIIDGFLGGSFLKRIADYLEQFDETTTI